ncbi:MAG: RAD55 family ATPase [Methanosarcinaceae archaeon]|nr:RAD55 family ATPase [Methanosarcinaceae archaeon]MDF1533366.1 RAD55 family ATPase [Methanosarcinaceae archaeon]
MDYSFDGTGGYKVPTGIAGLDVQLGGGVPPGITILILAEPGAGSEIFAQQFAYGGLVNNEEVFYFSSEHPVSEIVAEMEDFGWGEKDELVDKIEFIDAYAPRFYNVLPRNLMSNVSAKEFLKQGADSLNVLKTTVTKKHKGKYRGIIDSMSFFLRSYELNDVVETIEIMSSVGKLSGAVQLILVTTGMHDPVIENTLKHVCDGVIEFHMKERGSEIEHTILIRKMRGMITPSRTISYSLTHKGVELETTTRVL